MWVQLGLTAVFIVLTAWSNLAFHNVVAGSTDIPLWAPLVRWLPDLGERWFGEGLGTFLVNPVTYVLIPLVVLLLAGARLSTLGFEKGHRVGRALLICCSLPLAWFAYTLISGQQTIVRLLGAFASDFMQNGFLEEFLFRGAPADAAAAARRAGLGARPSGAHVRRLAPRVRLHQHRPCRAVAGHRHRHRPAISWVSRSAFSSNAHATCSSPPSCTSPSTAWDKGCAGEANAEAGGRTCRNRPAVPHLPRPRSRWRKPVAFRGSPNNVRRGTQGFPLGHRPPLLGA